MRTTDIFAATGALNALDTHRRLTGPGSAVSQALRMQTEVTRMYRDVGGPALAEQHRMLDRTVRASRDEMHLGMSGMARTAVAEATTSAGRMARLGLQESVVGIDRFTGVRVRETGSMFDRHARTKGRHATVPESRTHSLLTRAAAHAAPVRTTRTLIDDALAAGPLARIGTMRDVVGVGDIVARDRATRRTQLAIEARLRETTAVIESVRLTGPAFGLARQAYGSPALTGWQRAQLRTAERELRSVRAMAMSVPGLARRVQRQLAEVRAALNAERLAAQQAASHAVRAGSLAGYPSGLLTSAMPKYAMSSALPKYTMEFRAGMPRPSLSLLADTSWLARETAELALLTRGGIDPFDVAGTRGRYIGSDLHAATMGSLRTVIADMQRLSRAHLGRVGLDLADIGSPPFDVTYPDTALDALGDIIAETAFDAVAEEEPSTNEQALTAVVALVMWSRAASGAVQSRGQLLTTRGRLLIAQTGAVLQELGVAVADEAEQASEWVWTEPLWAARALRAVSAELTAEERLALRQRRRDLILAVAGATVATVVGPQFVGSPASLVAWSAVWAKLQSLYEDIARWCHAHGHDELVPADQRWWS